jgi:hypothetical protein
MTYSIVDDLACIRDTKRCKGLRMVGEGEDTKSNIIVKFGVVINSVINLSWLKQVCSLLLL